MKKLPLLSLIRLQYAAKRSAALMKAHGFMKAMNSITDALYSEVTAGFVSIIFEDGSGKHSDSILEITPILEGMAIPFIQSTTVTIYDDVLNAFDESEKRKMPVAILVNSLDLNKEVLFDQKQNLRKSFTYKRDIFSHVVHPMLSEFQYKVFLSKKLLGDISTITKPVLPNNAG